MSNEYTPVNPLWAVVDDLRKENEILRYWYKANNTALDRVCAERNAYLDALFKIRANAGGTLSGKIAQKAIKEGDAK
jgi:hypothetical protein